MTVSKICIVFTCVVFALALVASQETFTGLAESDDVKEPKKPDPPQSETFTRLAESDDVKEPKKPDPPQSDLTSNSNEGNKNARKNDEAAKEENETTSEEEGAKDEKRASTESRPAADGPQCNATYISIKEYKEIHVYCSKPTGVKSYKLHWWYSDEPDKTHPPTAGVSRIVVLLEPPKMGSTVTIQVTSVMEDPATKAYELTLSVPIPPEKPEIVKCNSSEVAWKGRPNVGSWHISLYSFSIPDNSWIYVDRTYALGPEDHIEWIVLRSLTPGIKYRVVLTAFKNGLDSDPDICDVPEDKEPTTKDKEPPKLPDLINTAGEDEKATGEDEKATGEDEKPTGEDKKPTGEDEKPTGEDEKPTSEDEKPTGEDEKPTGEDEKPTSEDEKPTGEDEKPTGQDEKPTGQDEKPTGEDDKPTSEDEKPTGEDEKPPGEDEELSSEEEEAEDNLPPLVPVPYDGEVQDSNFPQAEAEGSSNVTKYFLVCVTLLGAGVLVFCNRRKIMAYFKESRRPGKPKRPNSKEYNQLKNVEEALPKASDSADKYVF